MDDAVKQLAKKWNVSEEEANQRIERARRLLDRIEEQDLSDDSYETLNEQDILRLRTKQAERGVELTPDQAKSAVALICYARKILRQQ